MKYSGVVPGCDIADVRQTTFKILIGIFIIFFRKNMERNMQSTKPACTITYKTKQR